MDFNSLRKIADHPHTPPKTLAYIARATTQATVIRRVAQHRSTPQETLRWLIDQDPRDNSEVVAGGYGASTETLEYLYQKLATQEPSYALEELLRREDLPVHILEYEGNRILDEVVAGKRETGILDAGDDELDAVLLNNSTPFPIIRRALSIPLMQTAVAIGNKNVPVEELPALVSNLACSDIDSKWQRYCFAMVYRRKDITEELRTKLRTLIKKASLVESGYMFHVSTPEELRDMYEGATNEDVQQTILNESHVPMDLLLAALADNEDRGRGLGNELQNRAFKSRQIPVAKKIEQALLEENTWKRSEKLEACLLSHDLTVEQAVQLFNLAVKEKGTKSLQAAAKRGFLPLETLRKGAYASEVSDVEIALLLHPEANIEDRIEMFKSLSTRRSSRFTGSPSSWTVDDFVGTIIAPHEEAFSAWLEQEHPSLVGMPAEWVAAVLTA